MSEKEDRALECSCKRKFRKKPIVVEAEQWFPGKNIEGVRICPDRIRMPCIVTLEGNLNVSPGDWIITGINGEKYPCKPDIFDKTYEMVE